MSTAGSSPNKPRPEDPLVRETANMIVRIERNYEREGSGPGSRFEGRLLEDVQAEAVVREIMFRLAAAEQAAPGRYAALAVEAADFAEHLAHVMASAEAMDRVNGIRRRIAGEQ